MLAIINEEIQVPLALENSKIELGFKNAEKVLDTINILYKLVNSEKQNLTLYEQNMMKYVAFIFDITKQGPPDGIIIIYPY